jgi:hypothetical protein
MTQALDPVTEHHLRQVADRLADEFSGIFSEETIDRYLTESTDLLGEAKVMVYSRSSHIDSPAIQKLIGELLPANQPSTS